MERLMLVGKSSLIGRITLPALIAARGCFAGWLVRLVVVLVAFNCVLTSCVTIKSEYPKTSYYRLSSKPLEASAEAAHTEVLMVKSFSVDSEFDTDHLLALNPSVAGATAGASAGASAGAGGAVSSAEMQKYNYHRWISEPRELVTAYTVNRLQASQAFTGGVFTEATSVLPTLELEGRIVEFMGRNASADGANTATVVLHLALKRVGGDAPVQRILLQKIYTHSAPRPNDAAASIPDALGEALSVCLDAALKDIRAAVK
jgi:ABC-type uncharacterized transport system auxiliary subunit